jgi:predicted metalloprotease
MRGQLWRSRPLGIIVIAALAMTACTVKITGQNVPLPIAPNSNLSVVGDSHGSFDQTVKNSLDDVLNFWRKQYPSISGGKQLPELKGKLYSVDGAHPSDEVKQNGCLRKAGTDAVVDNAFYCELDDSIAWDRDPQHLVPALGAKYGPLLVAMVFAHEFGHAVQQRLGLFNQQAATIVHESQADCAAGAFTAYVMKGQAPHIRPTATDLDRALVGYLNVRDDTPADEKEISHGDGFDRIGSVADGFQNGVTDCYKSNWADRKFTERPFVPGSSDEQQQGNEPFSQVINPGSTAHGGGGLQPDLDRFWKAAAKTVGKTFTGVKITQADHPKCGDTSSEFGYCPDDNTIYFSRSFAAHAYSSMSVLNIDRHTANVSVVENQPGDFALGTLFAYGWAFAVRHQLFNHSLDDAPALLAASCYTGQYAKNINVEQGTAGNAFTLSPPDMDEATSAVLSLVGTDQAFGARGTTGFERVQAFIKGYNGSSLGVC